MSRKEIKLIVSILLLLCAAIMLNGCKKETVTEEKYDNGYYVGEFNDKGERHGQGTYYWEDGSKYEGEWENGTRTGYGVMTWANGAKYAGYWSKSQRSGYGEMKYSNNNIYKGDWLVDKRNGTGEFIFSDGTIFSCIWKNNNPTDEKCYLLLNMKSRYLWYNEIPKVDVNNYSSAEDMLERIKSSKDRGSYIYNSETAINTGASFLDGTTLGYGLGLRWNEDNDLRVAWVDENGPAKLFGVKRGWKVMRINSQDVSSFSSISVTPEREGESMSFDFLDENQNTRTVSLTARVFNLQSVFYQNTYQLSGKKIGYISIKSFLEQNTDELIESIDQLSRNGIQELIVDLRYCAGGNFQTLTDFAGYILPNSTNNKVFIQLKRNQMYQEENVVYHIQKRGNLNLNRIIVLTTGSTGNLGELLALSLRPYTNVIQIGKKTDGTDIYATNYWTFSETKSHHLVTCYYCNANGANSLGGLMPDYAAADGLDKVWGDDNEELLKTAFYFIANGTFPAKSSGKALQQMQLNRNVKNPSTPVKALEFTGNMERETVGEIK